MEALLVPLLILVLAGVAVVLAARAMGRRRPAARTDEAPQPIRNSAELARTAPAQPAHDDEDAPQRFPYRYRAIASKGEITREVSSNMLNDEIYGRIRTLAKSGDTEGAAAALTRHSDISLKQAREFIALLGD